MRDIVSGRNTSRAHPIVLISVYFHLKILMNGSADLLYAFDIGITKWIETRNLITFGLLAHTMMNLICE